MLDPNISHSQPRFDYEAVALGDREAIQEATARIRSICRTTAQTIIDIGKNLTLVKERLGHGNFGKWLAAEFDWDERTAQKMMAAAKAFKSAPISDLDIAPTALYLLSYDSTPEVARKEALALAKAGGTVSNATAREIVERHRTFPKFLTHLVAAGSLSNEHLAALLSLRDAYGEALLRQFTPRQIEFENSNAALLLFFLRPEHQPMLSTLGSAKPAEVPFAIVEALQLFLDEKSRLGGLVPQWHVAGLWWSSVAVLHGLTPDQLADSIDLWRGRYDDALAWWAVFGGDRKLQETDPAVYWGFYDDLKCSGALAVAANGERVLPTLQRMHDTGQYIQPTSMIEPA